MQRDANVGRHQVGLQTTDRLMLGAILRLEKHGVSDGSQGTHRENVRISAASHAEGRHGGGRGGVVVPRVTTELLRLGP